MFKNKKGCFILTHSTWLSNKSQDLSHALTGEEAYNNNRLTRPALISLAILTFITFIGNFAQLQLTAALPTIVQEFGISVTTGQWLTSIFQLIMAIMVPLTAFLTRRFSTRQIVITSMSLFTFGSVLAWLSNDFMMALVGRTLEAIGTGVMWPVLQITVFSVYPVTRRGMAMGSVGMAMSIAPAIGPTIGGLQTDINGWRSIFCSLTIIGAISVVLAVFFLHNFGEHDLNAHADFFSVGLSVIGFGGLMFGFTNIEGCGISHPLSWAPMIIGAFGIAWFVTRQLRAQKRGHTPLLGLNVLKNRYFMVGTICACLTFFAFSSIMVLIPLYIQSDRGFSATMSGLILLPGAFGMAISQYFGGRMLDRFGVRPVAMAGSIILFFGTVMMSLIDMDTWIWWISIWQFTRQIGMGFLLMPITTWSLNCLRKEELGDGSAVTNTMRQLWGAIGAPVLVVTMTVLTTLHHSGTGHAADVAASIFGVQWTLRISAIITGIMALIVIFGVKGEGTGSAHNLARRAIDRMRVLHIPHSAEHHDVMHDHTHNHY
ncbi:MFS transporter [Gardnerella swidsinskii]|uniref:MFS transporter n=1 Tax=Gardnerella swidsinskii TaxID=2792979 RepID=A0A9X7FF68_9BIFI|nr:MDR family MFS transporter [Gardnerella swidsinskii]NSX39639.1 multidrug efflux MFS transporter [Gardnerella vaginalis]RFT34074.1 MFS transporter [Bifidobacteriaceae bacterium NR020]RIY28803.1 MFS transporter [Bifidobacteriaceae bacterium NR016]NSX40591.1 multidrug efflux MFS transporter [Gardnerella vaginalis]PMC55088.1 MFS transporter [Gardnerella swidsinskii]